MCLKRGIEPAWIAKQVGHRNLQMIFKTYWAYIPKDKTNQDRNERLQEEVFGSDSSDFVTGVTKG